VICTLTQGPAQELEEKLGLPADEWDTQPWFQDVWFHVSNNTVGQREATSVQSEDDIVIEESAALRYKQARTQPMSPAKRLAYYLDLLCQVLAHETDALNRGQDLNAPRILTSSPVAGPFLGEGNGWMLACM
jgi:hypothetical protein